MDYFPNLEWLDAQNNNLSSFNGLEFAPNLSWFCAHHNDLTSLYGVEKFKQLRFLDVSSSELRSCRGLEKCLSLQEVNMAYNNMNDVEAVKALAELPYLFRINIYLNDFEDDQVQDIVDYFRQRKPMCEVITTEYDSKRVGHNVKWTGKVYDSKPGPKGSIGAISDFLPSTSLFSSSGSDDYISDSERDSMLAMLRYRAIYDFCFGLSSIIIGGLYYHNVCQSPIALYNITYGLFWVFYLILSIMVQMTDDGFDFKILIRTVHVVSAIDLLVTMIWGIYGLAKDGYACGTYVFVGNSTQAAVTSGEYDLWNMTLSIVICNPIGIIGLYFIYWIRKN